MTCAGGTNDWGGLRRDWLGAESHRYDPPHRHRTRAIVAAGILLFAFHGVATAAEQFEHVAVLFEQNVTDGDAEIVLEATAGDAGLAALKVVAPDGRTLIDIKAPETKLGLRHFKFESPEPPNDGSIQADFPEGDYSFSGRTVAGVQLHGKATLSHALPETVSFVRPRPDEEDLPVTGLTIEWRPAGNPAVFIVVIEQEDTNLELTATLPGNVTRFAVPDGFLDPDTDYKLAIGTLAQEGNSSFVETEFKTVGKE